METGFAKFAFVCTHVYVEPHVVFLADVGDFVDRIEGTYDGSTGGSVNEERNVALGLPFQYETLQLRGDHPALDVRGYHDAVVCAETADRGARFYWIVTLGGEEKRHIFVENVDVKVKSKRLLHFR